MALQVWLPLNGNLNNQGLSSDIVTNHGATINVNGKIGSCYQNTASNYCTIPVSIDSTKPFSFCFWYRIDTWVNWGTALTLNDASSAYIGICPHSNGTSVGTNWYEGSTAISDKYHSMTFSTGVWYHFAIVSNGSGVKTYINGAQSNVATTYSNNPNATFTQLTLFKRGTTSTYGRNSLNDIRIYDHALSDKEVHEISKGLVLHYKLDDSYIESTKNLVTGITAGGQTTVSDNTVTTSGNNGDTYFRLVLSEALVNGTTYTISCIAENIPKGKYWTFPIGAQNNTSVLFNIYNGYNSFTFVANSTIANCGTSLMMDDSYRADVYMNKCVFRNFQIEQKDHATGYVVGERSNSNIIYDCSGYGHDGTKVGTLTPDSNTPRYDCSTKFDSGANYINAGRGAMVTDAITVNLWIKYTTWSNPISCTENGGWNFEEGGGGIRFPVYTDDSAYRIAQSTITSASLEDDKWHMLSGTYDGLIAKIYIDGVEKGTITGSTAHKNIKYHGSNVIFVGAEAGGNATTPASNAFVGDISDVRIYCTALSPTDILELYNVGQSIDNKGNLYAYSFKEE